MEEELEKIPFEEYCRKVFDPKKDWEKPEALKGWRHLSQTMYILSPHVGATLGEWGAEVIKIEMPRLADPMRHTSPFNEAYLYPLTDERPMTGTGYGFLHANRNKIMMTLDYHHPEAKEIMRDLWRMSDSLAECYRPGTFNRWGIGYPQVLEVNPALIYCWLGGFGSLGPGRRKGSYDILGQSIGGLASITGQHEDVVKVEDEYQIKYAGGGFPAKHTNWIIDWVAGLMCACGLVAAGYWRRKTGLGTMIDFSQVSVSNRFTGYGLPLYGRFGVVRQRWGNWEPQLCVHGIIIAGKSDFPDSDNPQEADEARYLLVSAFQDEDFKELCDLIGRKDLAEKYGEEKERLKPLAQMEIYGAVEKWAKDKSRAECVEAIQDKGLLAFPVMSAGDIYRWPHMWERGKLRFLDDPIYGDVLQSWAPALMSETPPRVKWECRPLGADNIKILHDLLGMPMEKIKELYEKAVI
ncbi:MAG: CaiB/BaiF CoA transferase family protein [Candidatus Hydrothermarchaeota archaeon]